MNILWIGPIVPFTYVGNSKAVSPAANSWQSAFVKCLRDRGESVRVISYLPEPLFPKGLLVPSVAEASSENVKFAKFLNVPILRSKTLTRSIELEACRSSRADWIFSYNAYPWHVKSCSNIRARMGCKWANIVAEGQFATSADVNIFLSHWYYKNAPVRSKLFFPGGIDNPEKPVSREYIGDEKRVILYAGGFTQWTGINEFLSDFSEIDEHLLTRLSVHLYGKGAPSYRNMHNAPKADIVHKGFVTDGDLDAAMRDCFCFINPRPVAIPGGETNFPSKILNYLRFAKPIISTVTPGISPNYSSILDLYDPKTPLSIKLRQLLSMSQIEYQDQCLRMHRFALNHTWILKVGELLQELTQ